MRVVAFAVFVSCLATPIAARTARNPQVDYGGFRKLAEEVEPYRQKRLVDWAEFARMARGKGVLILDARSESAFAQGHIQGAVNLPVTDFTAPRLAEVIGDPDRPILIYCNNNFANNLAPVMLKSRPLALNINTFINLVGYGYRNVYELDEVIDFNDPKVAWVGTRPRPQAMVELPLR